MVPDRFSNVPSAGHVGLIGSPVELSSSRAAAIRLNFSWASAWNAGGAGRECTTGLADTWIGELTRLQQRFPNNPEILNALTRARMYGGFAPEATIMDVAGLALKAEASGDAAAHEAYMRVLQQIGETRSGSLARVATAAEQVGGQQSSTLVNILRTAQIRAALAAEAAGGGAAAGGAGAGGAGGAGAGGGLGGPLALVIAFALASVEANQALAAVADSQDPAMAYREVMRQKVLDLIGPAFGTETHRAVDEMIDAQIARLGLPTRAEARHFLGLPDPLEWMEGLADQVAQWATDRVYGSQRALMQEELDRLLRGAVRCPR